MKTVSYILNTWQRPHTLKEQYNAVKNQTIKTNEVLIWQNKPDKESIFFDFDESFNDAKISTNSYNYGVWSRFAFALNAKSDYICILDDDTIPQKKWSENCINNIEKQNGLYGTIGLIFNDPHYQSVKKHGWANPNNKREQVDIVGHAWFFHRDLLNAFWSETGHRLNDLCGEDVHFSYCIQKYLGLNTYVPPHPIDDIDLWGALPQKSYEYGVDDNALSCSEHGAKFGESLYHYYKKGFKLLEVQ